MLPLLPHLAIKATGLKFLSGVAGTRQEIVAPFVAAFGPPSKGDCLDTKPKAGSLADLITKYGRPRPPPTLNSALV